MALDLAARRRRAGRAVVQGVLGAQGCGKTTLPRVMAPLLQALGCSTLSLSIDDFYLPFAQRVALRQEDPRFRWRGPPGTHDAGQATRVLDDLQAGRATRVPRFDKSLQGGEGDRAGFLAAGPADVVWLEGWLVGCRPVDEARIDKAPWPIATRDDRDFARECNRRLAGYLPLWDRLDGLLVLWMPDFATVRDWRVEAERRMRDAGRDGMDDTQVDAFVTHFWKALHPDLFVRPRVDSPRPGDRVAVLDARRRVVSVRQRAARPERRNRRN